MISRILISAIMAVSLMACGTSHHVSAPTQSLSEQALKPAADINLLTSLGETTRLSLCTTPMALVVFSDPTCDICESHEREIAQSEALINLVNSNRLSIYTVCIDDDNTQWKAAAPAPAPIISTWNYDGTVLMNDTYNVSGFPEMYLIDTHNMKILLEKPDLQQLIKMITKVNLETLTCHVSKVSCEL